MVRIFLFCMGCVHRKQYESVTFEDSTLLRPNKQVTKNIDLGVQLKVKLECGTPILLGLEDAVSNPIQVLDIQHHRSVPNLDVSPLVRNEFEDMVVDAFSVEESADMSTKSSSVIEFNGDLDFINLKENWFCTFRGLVEKMIKKLRSVLGLVEFKPRWRFVESFEFHSVVCNKQGQGNIRFWTLGVFGF